MSDEICYSVIRGPCPAHGNWAWHGCDLPGGHSGQRAGWAQKAAPRKHKCRCGVEWFDSDTLE